VLAVRRDGHVAVAGDGQVTLDHGVVKAGARKVRRLADGNVLVGFAGGAADALTLMERFEERLRKHPGQLERAAVELVREWRTDRALRRLEAMMIVADRERTLLMSGTGDLIEPDDGIVAVGSGSTSALSAARALAAHTELDARSIAVEAMRVAASVDIYTNDRIVVEEL
jgi:ATP-dependent HslUV protease subunit HslV